MPPLLSLLWGEKKGKSDGWLLMPPRPHAGGHEDAQAESSYSLEFFPLPGKKIPLDCPDHARISSSSLPLLLFSLQPLKALLICTISCLFALYSAQAAASASFQKHSHRGFSGQLMIWRKYLEFGTLGNNPNIHPKVEINGSLNQSSIPQQYWGPMSSV